MVAVLDHVAGRIESMMLAWRVWHYVQRIKKRVGSITFQRYISRSSRIALMIISNGGHADKIASAAMLPTLTITDPLQNLLC